ncbi:hypothetical protein SAMN02746000_03490 [Paracoccus sp. J56]|nr:hypothetical protein SAMN02746000_03490 [Paracoccus sp. J56]
MQAHTRSKTCDVRDEFPDRATEPGSSEALAPLGRELLTADCISNPGKGAIVQ